MRKDIYNDLLSRLNLIKTVKVLLRPTFLKLTAPNRKCIKSKRLLLFLFSNRAISHICEELSDSKKKLSIYPYTSIVCTLIVLLFFVKSAIGI